MRAAYGHILALVLIAPWACAGNDEPVHTPDGGGAGGQDGGAGGAGAGGAGGGVLPLEPPLPTRIATGDGHSCALNAEGALRCWGYNEFGQLGYGTASSIGDEPGEMPPADVEAGATVVEVVAGGAHTCARLLDGKVRCWGFNEYGQLGRGDLSAVGDEPGELPPADVDLGEPATQLVAGGLHTCALLQSGVVRCWGGNDYGQLGQGNTLPIGDEPGEMPPPDVPLGEPASHLFAGYTHTCARMASGTLRCWGNNEHGQLGYGTTSSVGDGVGEMPPADVPVGGIVARGAGGGEHTCAILTTGVVRCWGDNAHFQLGDPVSKSIGGAAGQMPPPDVSLGTGLPLSIEAGDRFTCVLFSGGAVRCWGLNSAGQCGAGITTFVGDMAAELPPADVAVGGASPVAELSAGHSHACVRLSSGAIRCWGGGGSGALGQGSLDNVGDGETPASQPDVSVF
jgi:alpha-tubulin suppressor-like RCC1 family protein